MAVGIDVKINPKDLKVKLWKDATSGFIQILEQPEEWRGINTHNKSINDSNIFKGSNGWFIASRGRLAIDVESSEVIIIFLNGNSHDDGNVVSFKAEYYYEVLATLREFGCIIEGDECSENQHDYVPIEACGFVYQICRKCQKQQEEVA